MPSSAEPRETVWTQAGGGAARAGRTPQVAARGVWAAGLYRLPGNMQAGVVFDASRRLFAADLAGHVGAFSGAGRVLWRRELDTGIVATPASDPAAGRLYVGTLGGRVLALSVADGTTIWERRLPSEHDPRIVGDLLWVSGSESLVVSSWGGRVHALDAGTGETQQQWDAGISPQSAAAATADGDVLFMRVRPDEGPSLVRARVGVEATVLYTAPENPRGAYRTVVVAAPVVDTRSDTVFFVTNEDRRAFLRSWSLRSGGLRWSVGLEAVVIATPALAADGGVVVADMAGGVVGISPDGVLRWRYATGCEYVLAGAVCDGGGGSYVADPVGALHWIDALGSGEVLFQAPRSLQSRPSFDGDGNLLVPCTNGVVYGRRLGSGEGLG